MMTRHAAPLSRAEPRLWDGFLRNPEAAAPPLDPTPVPHLRGERVLVTGAGGYLGSAAARALAEHHVAHLCLLDIVEHGLYDLQQQLDRHHHNTPYDLVLGSVADPALLREILHQHRPTLVLHAAALKHVPMLEDNALAAAATNVLGTAALCTACQDTSVQRLVLCSTDKAVAPVGVMGATKHLAEQLALHATTPSGIRVLRLCNVLGSTGSVAPLFAAQIAHGDPLTVTERDVTRLWISQGNAVACMLEAFHPDLPTALAIPRHVEQRHVTELLAFMLQRANVATPHIAYTGLRRGERLSEHLHSPGELPVETGSAALQSLVPVLQTKEVLDAVIANLTAAVRARNHAEVRRVLNSVMQPVVEAQP